MVEQREQLEESSSPAYIHTQPSLTSLPSPPSSLLLCSVDTEALLFFFFSCFRVCLLLLVPVDH